MYIYSEIYKHVYIFDRTLFMTEHYFIHNNFIIIIVIEHYFIHNIFYILQNIIITVFMTEHYCKNIFGIVTVREPIRVSKGFMITLILLQCWTSRVTCGQIPAWHLSQPVWKQYTIHAKDGWPVEPGETACDGTLQLGTPSQSTALMDLLACTYHCSLDRCS